jgi:hypothetical protein
MVVRTWPSSGEKSSARSEPLNRWTKIADREDGVVLSRHRPWPTRDQLRLAIVTWIETTDHRRYRGDTLGRLTPIEYETLHQTARAA